jgi:DNA-binding NtrC family response regulator
MLRRLSMNVVSCAALKQTEEVLSQQAVALIFCDENLSDGSFRDLLVGRKNQKVPPIVVAIRTGEWNEYLEAMRLGAFDAIRCPLLPRDVERVVDRALRDNQTRSDRMIA